MYIINDQMLEFSKECSNSANVSFQQKIPAYKQTKTIHSKNKTEYSGELGHFRLDYCGIGTLFPLRVYWFTFRNVSDISNIKEATLQKQKKKKKLYVL